VSKPTITDSIGGYVLEWAAEFIKIQVNRLKTHTDGRVTGEITVTTTNPKAPGHLHQAQLNFSASGTRGQLAKKLNARVPLDWDAIIEQLCFHVLERARTGGPVQELWTSTEVKPPEYLLYPFVLKNLPSVIFGLPSAAKSTVALILSQVMLLPWDDNPLDIQAPGRSIRSLYLDWETDGDVIQWQMTRLQRGMDLPPLAVSYRNCGLPLAQDLEQIRKHIDDTKADLIIIDSLGLASGGELKDAGPAIAFYSALRQLNISSLILAHTSKNREDKQKSIFGSIYFEAQARNIWEIRKVQEADEDEISVGLFHRKPPPFSKLHKPLGMRLHFNGTGMTIAKHEPQSVREFVSAIGTQAQIKEALKDGAMSTQEIMDALEINRGNADMALKRLRDKKQISRVEDGKWGLLLQ